MNEIIAKNLTKKYGKITAVNGINFEVSAGKIFAFLGPNGAGKTTTIKMLTGLSYADSGEIIYREKAFNPDKVEIKSVIGVVPQHNNVDRDLTVTQNLRVHGLLYGLRGKKLNGRINEILEFSGLENQSYKKAGDLSGGMKRRLVIGRALLHSPSILFLDEPTVGLDPASRRHIWDFIRKINKTAGCTVFLTTHYIEEADLLADMVTMIDRGSIIKSGTPEELKKDLGRYCVEKFHDDRIEEHYFASHDEAVEFLSHLGEAAKIREVNLEDAYLAITGRRIDV